MDDINNAKKRHRQTRRTFVNKKMAHIEKDQYRPHFTGDLLSCSRIHYDELNSFEKHVDYIKSNGELVALFEFKEALNNKLNPSKFGLLKKHKLSK